MTLVLASVLGIVASATLPTLSSVFSLAPAALLVFAGSCAVVLVKSSRQAATLALVGGAATAAWIFWLRAYLFGLESSAPFWPEWLGPGSKIVGAATVLLLLATAVLVVRAGGHLFALILAVVFGYLALQAIRNMNLFGLVAGFVLTWNFAGCAVEMAITRQSEPPRRPSLLLTLAPRVALAMMIGLLILAIVSGRFERAGSEPRRFGLRETPLAYAHEAAQFAGQPCLPDRALVFDLAQAGVFVFHNGPQRKVFMDGRLEVPDRTTFATYVRLENMLNEGRRGWSEPVRRMGNPSILLSHEKEYGAEATLLGDPEWRCVYFDAVASVFVARDERGLEDRIHTIDFAARHFRDRTWQAIPPDPRAIGEARALLNVGSALRVRDGVTGRLPDSIMLCAGDRFHQAIALNPGVASHWAMLGRSLWNMVPDLKAPPPGPHEPWDPARGILPAQGTFCFRRALELDPTDNATQGSLLRSLEAREMPDAEQAVAAFRSQPRESTPDWPTCNRIAMLLMHLGRPADAR